MKQKFYFLFLFVLLLFPVTLRAKDGIQNYYIDATVLESGDIEVKELFILEGSFNGYERIIDYQNTKQNANPLYNASGITIDLIQSMIVNKNSTFQDIYQKGIPFQKINKGVSGDDRVYEEANTASGKRVKIYNPSSSGRHGFYIAYTLKDVVVNHEDVAELWWNIFSDQQQELIKNFEMYLHIPNNQSEIRSWAHGPLWGDVQPLEDKQTVKVTIQDLSAKTPMDIRVAFDKNIVSGNKNSGISNFENIIKEETQKADNANIEREQARKEERLEHSFYIFLFVMSGVWLIGLFILLIYIYYKYDKEYQSHFQQEYYREFPSKYGPEIVGYLLHKNVSDDDLSAAILNLIYKKVITFEPCEKKDYKLVKQKTSELDEKERALLYFLFEDATEVTLSSLKKEAKSSYETFLLHHQKWKNLALKEAKTYRFYEAKGTAWGLSILYCLIGLILSIVCFTISPFYLLVVLVAISSLVYLVIFKKRTQYGNEEYHKWLALKHYMEDFGLMNEKDLPEIVLWEKYLVYAVSLGCATKLAKTMKLKIKELNMDTYDMENMLWNMNRMNMMLAFHRSFARTMHSAIDSANQAKIAASSNSSGGGFGGGFSGGGGFGGGGGGGGRF